MTDYSKYCWDINCPMCGKKSPSEIGFRYTSVPQSEDIDDFDDRWVNDETGEIREVQS